MMYLLYRIAVLTNFADLTDEAALPLVAFVRIFAKYVKNTFLQKTCRRLNSILSFYGLVQIQNYSSDYWKTLISFDPDAFPKLV